jgi:hypothetical protein
VSSLHGKLFAWHRLQLQADEVRVRLKQALSDLADDATLHALQRESDRLREEMDTMLREVEALRVERAKSDSARP